jgi:hypothetical protein
MIDVVVIPGTGVAVSLDAEPAELAQAWDELSSFMREAQTAKREISDEVTRRLDHEGRRSLVVDGVKFETTAPTERQWDLPALQNLLLQLVSEGTISEKKADACIKWEPKPVWSELKTLVSDPRCSARMALMFEEVPANRYAKVTRA